MKLMIINIIGLSGTFDHIYMILCTIYILNILYYCITMMMIINR